MQATNILYSKKVTEYYDKIKNFDYYYYMSDSSSVWKKGELNDAIMLSEFNKLELPDKLIIQNLLKTNVKKGAKFLDYIKNFKG